MELQFSTADDFTLSPYTGWTRERWIELAEKMIIGLQPYLTPGKGGLALPNPVRWMDAFLPEPEKMESFYWMEGYTRSRLLLAAWLVGTGKTTLDRDGVSINVVDQFIEGLLSASNPQSPDFIGDRYQNNQWIAETSTVAYALYQSKDIIWERMNRRERDLVVKWMQAATGRNIPHNNWYLFVANTNLVLKSFGENYNKEELENCLEQIRGFYLGDGWFMDGDDIRGYSVDMYNPWGFHYFLPAFLKISLEDSKMEEWIATVLKKFVISFYRFFAANGAIPMWGRSWAYRPALTTPFLWAEILGVSPLSPGETRRLVSGQMKFYVENGFFQDNLTPTMGYAGANYDLIDPYSQFGSPYWSSGIFHCLLMAKEHPFWMEKEQPLLVERESYCVSEPTIGMQIAGNQQTGEVQLVNHRAWHQKEGPGTKYAKKYTNLSYSSHFGIDLKRDEYGYNCDNMISISPDGKLYSQRIVPYYIKVAANYGESYHYPLSGFPFVDGEDPTAFSGDLADKITEDRSVKITTRILIKDFLQIRVHTINTKRKLAGLREGGFAVNFKKEYPNTLKFKDAIGVQAHGKGSFIKSLWGYTHPDCHYSSSLNTMGGQSVIPMLKGDSLMPGEHIFAVIAGTWQGPVESISQYLDVVKSFRIDCRKAVVYFNDGSEYIFEV